MSRSEFNYNLSTGSRITATWEELIEIGFIEKLQNLKYEYRPDIRHRTALEPNFHVAFDALNRVKLADGETTDLLGANITQDLNGFLHLSQSINSKNPR
jgi:type I restriction enzyme R subunit